MATTKAPEPAPEQAPIIANLRIQKEQAQLARSKPTYIHEITVQNDNQKQWDILLLPPRPPYNAGMFRLRITFPSDYPFKPPHLRFVTPIYHPNIDEKGQMCLAILQCDNWKPGTNIESIIQSLIFLLNDPEPERPLRYQIAEQIYKNNDDIHVSG
ncbi:unnamed protein product [Onchocerca ochengi]|uniref:UBC core domain-containing protein n=1 Tax=Onchocerca ochengi TaxID=42157 RepID=A0A182EG38_ONCOC|nr:unnamed protein product [Onchocerca ochengi]